MTRTKRILALLCAIVLCFGLVTGCKSKTSTDATQSSAQATDPSDSTPVSGQNKMNYVVTLTSAGGLPLSGVTVLAYADAALSDLTGYSQTDENGQAVLSMPAAAQYYLDVTDAPEGYLVEESYLLTKVTTEIVLTSQVIADPSLTGVSYELGDVIHDIEFTDTDGNTWKLSDVLKEKDMVMLNFWYTGCDPCISEFPYIQAAYEKYGDDVEIFALNPTDETMDSIALTQSSMGMTFPMGSDANAALYSAFNAGGTPTTVVIDRYGVVCLVVEGSLPEERYFDNIFSAFIGENYTQKLYTNGLEDLIPVIMPDVQMPAPEEMAAVLNQGGLDAVYSADDDDEMSWPFVITQKGGVDCIVPANAGVSGSYAILYAHVNMKAGQALAMDYYASCESGADILYVLVDRNDIYKISGEDSGWSTCYPWVATEDGTYEIVLCYMKDSSENVGDDTVYIKNLRTVDSGKVDVPSYIPRFAATNMNEDGFGYQDYITPVYNEKDGYYHVNSANGPLLLANLLMSTRFSNDSVYNLLMSDLIIVDGVNYAVELMNYCTYASNAQIYSLCPVNQELKELLEMVATAVGIEKIENEWLQICEYYDAYGTGGVELADPIQGISADSAYEAKLGTNTVTYDRILMPRGLLYKFVPTKSGAYRITSDSEFEVEGWIFLRDQLVYQGEDIPAREVAFYTYEANERMYYSETDISMVVYLEAGKEYFIDIAYYDLYGTGTFTFDIEYVAKELQLFVSCSPGYFTYEDETTYEIVAGGIKVALGKDGFYHELLSDGSLGSIVYADFVSTTGLFASNTIEGMLESRAFNFALTEDDETVLDYYDEYTAARSAADFKAYMEGIWGSALTEYWKQYKVDEMLSGTYEGADTVVAYYENFTNARAAADFSGYMQTVWGEDFDYYWEYMQVDDVLDGVYHGKGKDMTDVVRKYAAKLEKSGDKQGCVAVTEELAEALQMLVDKFSFKDVENSWIKLCYYYDYFGPDANK